MKHKILPIKDIIVDEKTYPRAHLSETVVRDYAKAMDRGDNFPPIYVALFKGKYYLVDGRHRMEAFKVRDEEYIDSEVKDNFPSLQDIFLASIRSNLKHGLRLNSRDRLKVALTMKDMKMDITDITKMTGVSPVTINNITTHKLSKIVFQQAIKEGKIPAKVSEKTVRTERELGAGVVDEDTGEVISDKELERESQLQMLDEIYGFFKSGKFDISDSEVRVRIAKIKKVFKKKFQKIRL